MTLKFNIKTASLEQIYSHLANCDNNFAPRLSSRVDLLTYSRKLFERSVSFEAWTDSMLIGMINAYFDDATELTGFITNVSILKEHMGKGLASALLEMCLKHARYLGFRTIRLEVSLENIAAIKLYTRAGFRTTEESGANVLMELEILGQSTR